MIEEMAANCQKQRFGAIPSVEEEASADHSEVEIDCSPQASISAQSFSRYFCRESLTVSRRIFMYHRL